MSQNVTLGLAPIFANIGARQLYTLLREQVLPLWNTYTYDYPFPDNATLVTKDDNITIPIPESEAIDVLALAPFLQQSKSKTWKPIDLAFMIHFRIYDKMRMHMMEVSMRFNSLFHDLTFIHISTKTKLTMLVARNFSCISHVSTRRIYVLQDGYSISDYIHIDRTGASSQNCGTPFD